MNRLRQLRIDANLTVEAVAERSGVSVRTIYRLEADEVKRPSLDSLQRLGEVLGDAPSRLLLPAFAPLPDPDEKAAA